MKLKWVEAGAQGPHKIQRGYLPKEVYSAHWIEDINFRDAVDNFVIRERKEVDYEIEELMKYSPYRNNKEDKYRAIFKRFAVSSLIFSNQFVF